MLDLVNTIYCSLKQNLNLKLLYSCKYMMTVFVVKSIFPQLYILQLVSVIISDRNQYLRHLQNHLSDEIRSIEAS